MGLFSSSTNFDSMAHQRPLGPSDQRSASSDFCVAEVPPPFKKRPTWRTEIEGTLPRWTTGSASSRGVQRVSGRSEVSGGSQATREDLCRSDSKVQIFLHSRLAASRREPRSMAAGQGRKFLHAFDDGQTMEGFLPTFTPDAEAVSFEVESVANLLIGVSFECEQNDLSTMGESLGRPPCSDLMFAERLVVVALRQSCRRILA